MRNRKVFQTTCRRTFSYPSRKYTQAIGIARSLFCTQKCCNFVADGSQYPEYSTFTAARRNKWASNAAATKTGPSQLGRAGAVNPSNLCHIPTVRWITDELKKGAKRLTAKGKKPCAAYMCSGSNCSKFLNMNFLLQRLYSNQICL